MSFVDTELPILGFEHFCPHQRFIFVSNILPDGIQEFVAVDQEIKVQVQLAIANARPEEMNHVQRDHLALSPLHGHVHQFGPHGVTLHQHLGGRAFVQGFAVLDDLHQLQARGFVPLAEVDVEEVRVHRLRFNAEFQETHGCFDYLVEHIVGLETIFVFTDFVFIAFVVFAIILVPEQVIVVPYILDLQ